MADIPSRPWVFYGRLKRVVDGDTIDVHLDVGMHAQRLERLRLLGVNAPEKHGDTHLAGLAAEDYVESWMQAAATGVEFPLVIQTFKSDVFGRFLAQVWRASDGANLNADLITTGQAVEFMT